MATPQQALATLEAHSSVYLLLCTWCHQGLCIPEEWREEIGREGAPEFQEIEDGGLGEGEGAKDVSDRIQSEDQLEGLRNEQDKEDTEKQPKVESSLQVHSISPLCHILLPFLFFIFYLYSPFNCAAKLMKVQILHCLIWEVR